MNFPNTPYELADFFGKEVNDYSKVLVNFSSKTMEHITTINRERRQFYQNIAIASATILGLSSVFSSLQSPRIFVPYMLVAIATYAITICIVFLYTRIELDEELISIIRTNDNYSAVVEDLRDLATSYITPALGTNSEDQAKTMMKAYFDKREEINNATEVKRGADNISKSRKERSTNSDTLQFYGELITFLFSFATFFILLGISGHKLAWYWIPIAILAIFTFTFTKLLHRLLLLTFSALSAVGFGR